MATLLTPKFTDALLISLLQTKQKAASVDFRPTISRQLKLNMGLSRFSRPLSCALVHLLCFLRDNNNYGVRFFSDYATSPFIQAFANEQFTNQPKANCHV